MTASEFKTAAIIVTFHPDPVALARLMALLSPQVEKTYIVDNTPGGFTPPDEIASDSNVTLVPLGENRGVAAAHNAGIDRARRDGFSHVLLMDQDSVPAADMVSALSAYLSELKRAGLRIAAIGPQRVDARTGRPIGFISTRKGRYTRIRNAETSWVRCDYLTTSGTLIPMEVLDAVGGMEEAFFIDGVDIEWGYRATSMGFNCIGVFETSIKQTKGEKILSVLGFNQALYVPARHYYAFRNFCALMERRYVSAAWKRHVLLTSPFYALMLSTVIAPRLKNLEMVLRGIAHGLSRRYGPLS